MRKTLLLSVFFKNIIRHHPRYLYLLRKNKSLVLPNNSNIIKKKNIFIITSCVNTHENIDYPIHNVHHTANDRLAETIAGLKSVRDNYAESYIIFLESSKISNEDQIKIKKLVDEYYNYSDQKELIIARKHYNKGVPQFTVLIKFLEENMNNYCADIFHFLLARYSLTTNITNNTNLSVGANFLNYPEYNNVSTRYFLISKFTMFEIIKPFRKTLYCAIFGASVEDFIHGFFRKNTPLKSLGIKGLVNGEKMIYE